MSSAKHKPWLWIPSLFVAEEIPLAMVAFVSVLMFMQFGTQESYGDNITISSIMAGMLWLPWTLRSFVRSKVRNQGSFRAYLYISQLLIFLSLTSLALYLTGAKVSLLVMFSILFFVSSLSAWHDLLSNMYYNRMLFPREQHIFGTIKVVASQSALVVTYGILIILVGFFEVFFRSYQKAWAMENYVLMGVFLIVMILNALLLKNPKVLNPHRYQSLKDAFKNEMRTVDRISQKRHILPILTSLFFLILPQALMFNSRVFFLLATEADGGLECSVQEVGFAQGTVGVIAFSFGIGFGKSLLKRFGRKRLFLPMCILFTLSPVCYAFMSAYPLIDNMMALCCMTFIAQLLFGFGLNVCMMYVEYTSGNRYRNTLNYLFVPLVAAMMLVPLTMSGWMCAEMGFKTFFLVDALTAPLAWILLQTLKIKKLLLQNEK